MLVEFTKSNVPMEAVLVNSDGLPKNCKFLFYVDVRDGICNKGYEQADIQPLMTQIGLLEVLQQVVCKAPSIPDIPFKDDQNKLFRMEIDIFGEKGNESVQVVMWGEVSFFSFMASCYYLLEYVLTDEDDNETK